MLNNKQMREIKIKQVLGFLEDHFDQRGFAPTQREIAKECNLNRRTVRNYLEILEERDAIQVWPGVARGIRLMSRPEPDIHELRRLFEAIEALFVTRGGFKRDPKTE